MSYRTYLPLTRASPRREKRGIAWYSWNNEFKYLDWLRSTVYYNSSSYKHLANGRCYAMVRGNLSPESALYWQKVAKVLGTRHEAYTLTLNEPEQPSQDNLGPGVAKAFMASLRQALPKATFVGPNVTCGPEGIKWVGEYLRQGGTPFPIWGVHQYDQSGLSPTQAINKLAQVVQHYGYTCDRVWFTEIGSTDPIKLGGWLREAEKDTRVKMMFAYTAWEARPPVLNMLQADAAGRPSGLNAYGRAWVDN